VRGANGRGVSRGRFRVAGCGAFRLDFDGGSGGEAEETALFLPVMRQVFAQSQRPARECGAFRLGFDGGLGGEAEETALFLPVMRQVFAQSQQPARRQLGTGTRPTSGWTTILGARRGRCRGRRNGRRARGDTVEDLRLWLSQSCSLEATNRFCARPYAQSIRDPLDDLGPKGSAWSSRASVCTCDPIWTGTASRQRSGKRGFSRRFTKLSLRCALALLAPAQMGLIQKSSLAVSGFDIGIQAR
jgi:hypothetical protein